MTESRDWPWKSNAYQDSELFETQGDWKDLVLPL